MLKNYFKIAWRHLLKSKFYSLVNIVGLSSGIAFTLLIAAYVWSELQVNKDLKNNDRQYIIQSKWHNENQGYPIASYGPLAKALKESYPNLVANYYRFDGITSNISKGDKNFREGIQMGDSTLLEMYGFKLLYGSAATALKDPYSIVISTEKAIKYFGQKDVVGQTLTIENFSGTKHDFKITGVLDGFAKNSVTQFIADYPNGLFISSANLAFFGRNMDWDNPSIAGYIELQKNVSPAQLEKAIDYLVKQNVPPQLAASMTPYIVPLDTYYLDANNGVIKKMLYALSAIAIFILLMAIVNFVNMSVSRSASRMREIGIRKVLGGLKKQLITQFLIESLLLVSIATLFAFVIYEMSLGLFSSILGKDIPELTSFPLYFLLFPLVLIFLIGMTAGIYPAFVLSSLKSVESLKGKLPSVKENIYLRKSLIAFQFGIATMAFVGAIIISDQIAMFFNNDLGYNKEYVLSAQVPRNWSTQGVNKMERVRDELALISKVKDVTLSYEIPDGNNGGQVPLYKSGSDSALATGTQLLISDENYIKTYKIPLEAGSFFEGRGLDSGKMILNNASVKALGFSDAADAVGKQVRIAGDPTVFTVKGVTRDFHFGSMQREIPPILMLNVTFAPQYRYLSLKLEPGNIANTIDAIQKRWSALMPGAPFEYRFMDDTLAKLYKTEIQLKKAAYTATALAMIIALLGVIGLISLSIQKRTKEIGIRRVLGSSVTGIMTLFMKEFLWIILVAGIVTCPVAYLIMQEWLKGYAYRIDISMYPFLLSVIILAGSTLLLIALQTVKAASNNPVESLRSE